MTLAETVAQRFSQLPSVRAVALAGSRGAAVEDAGSDIDLYVYASADIPIESRAAIAAEFADRRELDNRFWELGDEWIDRESGTVVDVMFREPAWIEDQLDRVLVRHQASLGYSTCFWWNVRESVALFDPEGWYARLQQRARGEYPEELRQAILTRNLTVMCGKIASYRDQIAAALRRGDRVSTHHRLAAFLASYFDVVFAWNRVPHPGEKRLMQHSHRLCAELPDNFIRVEEALTAAPEDVLAIVDDLAQSLRRMTSTVR